MVFVFLGLSDLVFVVDSSSVDLHGIFIILFAFTAEWNFTVYVYYMFMVHSPANGHLGPSMA